MPKTTDPIVELGLRYIEHYIGVPYGWGGDDPSAWDCSGLAIEFLQACGKYPQGQDTTADGLMRRWISTLSQRPYPGCLALWGTKDKATHVEIVIHVQDTKAFCLGASGGGSKTLTDQDAWFVKVRPVEWRTRQDFLGYVDPFLVPV